MGMLEDGSVLPSFLGLSQGPGETGSEINLNDQRLRVGRIVGIYSPDASDNVNGKFFEYDVECDIGGGLTKIYPRSCMTDMFGGVADHFRWTPRIEKPGSGQINYGTRVLLMCPNGHSGRSIIIGCAKHFGNKTAETADDGHNLEWEFNGIRFNVVDDGSCTLVFKGPTNANGTLRSDGNKDDAGATLTVEKDGTIRFFTMEPGSDTDIENRITLDHTAGEMLLESSGAIRGETKKKFDVKATDGFQFNSSSGGVSIGVQDKVLVDSEGVEFGDATDNMLLGSTHIQDLSTFLTSLSTDSTQIALYLTGAATAMKVPISGPIAGSALIQQAAMTFTTMVSDIQQFAQKLQEHLSKKNKLD